MVRHTRQNRFAGSTGQNHRIEGGLKNNFKFRYIDAKQLGDQCNKKLADESHCPLAVDHGWLDKEDGAPHPGLRLAAKQEDEVTMTAEPATTEKITNAEMPEFTKVTKALISEIVNDHGIKYRIIDGGHLLLYPPVTTDRPYKVAAKRQDPINRQILEVQFMEKYGLRAKGDVSVRPAKATEKPAPAPKVAKAQPRAAKPPAPAPEPPVATRGDPDLVVEKVREVIGILHEALGIEDEAVEAIVGFDEMKKLCDETVLKNAALTTENNNLRDALDKDRTELTRLRADVERKTELVGLEKARADEAIGQMTALRKILGGN